MGLLGQDGMAASVVPANAGTHNHRCLWRKSLGPQRHGWAAAYGSLLSQGRRDGERGQADELIRARYLVTALINPSRASEWPCPRGSSTWRSRNKPVSRKPSCRSWSDQPFGPPSPSRKNAGSRSSRSRQRLAGLPRHRAAGFRRHVDQIGGLAGRGAVFQIEPEAEFGQHRQFEPDQMHGRLADVVEIVERALEHLVDVLVRIAFRQQPRQRSQMGHAIDRMR